MDIHGLTPLFGQQVIIALTNGPKFVGVLKQIPNSTSTIELTPLPPDLADQYSFAINGVSALDVSGISFVQRLNQPH